MVQLLALYGLGFTSEVYRRARRRTFTLRACVQNSIVKMLLAEMGFRAAVGGRWSEPVSKLPGLSKRALCSHVQGIFSELIATGTISADSVQRMCRYAFRKLDQ